MLRIKFREGRDGRHRWFAVNDKDVTKYSSMPYSFPSEQQAWENAEWALGASVAMLYDDVQNPEQAFVQRAAKRAFTQIGGNYAKAKFT